MVTMLTVLLFGIALLLIGYTIYLIDRAVKSRYYRKNPSFELYSYIESDNSNDDNDDGRRIDGHPLRTNEDWEKWYVIKGYADGIYRRLKELEKAISSVYLVEEDAKSAMDEWDQRYDSYRSICMKYGLWNDVLGDKFPFIPYENQRQLEKVRTDQIHDRYASASAYRAEMKYYNKIEQLTAMMDNYLSYHKNAGVLKTQMIKDIAKDSRVDIDFVREVYKAYKDCGKIDEYLYNGHYRVKSKSNEHFSLRRSEYEPGCYADVDSRMLYKVEYTVGKPENVNKDKNTCEFVSLSSGRRYFTSLVKCTCPSFTNKLNPCKHMVALAIHLGYYDPRDAK